MIEVTKRRERRRKQPLDNVKETRRYWKQKQEALDRTFWRIHLKWLRQAKTDHVMMIMMIMMMIPTVRKEDHFSNIV